MTVAPGAGVCSSCGAALKPATTYLSEGGPVCWTCLGRLQSQQEQAVHQADRRERSLTVRARMLGGLHATLWGLSVVIAHDQHDLPGWLASLLLVEIALLVLGLTFRRRAAYFVALGVDAACALGIVVRAAIVLPWHQAGPVMTLAIFPIALFAFTRWLRAAYAEPPRLGEEVPLLRRWAVPALALAVLVGAGVVQAVRSRPADPGRDLMRTALPAWQVERSHAAAGADDGPAARDLFERAQRWPALAGKFEALDRAWPDEAAVRDAAKALNGGLAMAGLPYFADVWVVGERPIVFSDELVAHVPWRIGARTVDVLRLRRLDHLNVEFGVAGATEQGQLPIVMLDRIEAALARDLPRMFAPTAGRASSELNDFDRAALVHARTFFEARLGADLGAAVAALRARDDLYEEMRARLNGGELQLAPPDGFVFGAEWLAQLEPMSDLGRSSGRLVLDGDLKKVAGADERLREPSTKRALDGALDLMAIATEAHEARHAADVDDSESPPALIAAMSAGASSPMIRLAAKELRAYLGELHDAPLPACVTLGRMMRGVYGRAARPNPHAFATLTILGQLGIDTEREPLEQLSAVCRLPDAELRHLVETAHAKLYGAAMPAGLRGQ